MSFSYKSLRSQLQILELCGVTLSGVGGKAVWFLLAPYRCDTKFKRACFHLGIHVGPAQLLLRVFVDRCAEKSECVGWGCLSESSDYA